jgi:hypothetical protein
VSGVYTPKNRDTCAAPWARDWGSWLFVRITQGTDSMDGSHFDTLTRSLSTAGSRRRALGGLLTGVFGVLGWQGQDDAAAHDLKATCKKKSGKAKKKCLKKARKHKAEHASETPPTDLTCTPDCAGKLCGSNGCGGSCGSCSACKQCSSGGRCVTSPDFTACGGGKQCSGGVCATPPGCENAAGCIHGNMCCSGSCTCPAFDADGFCSPVAPADCTLSGTGQPCSFDKDCGNGNCVGFVCRTN